MANFEWRGAEAKAKVYTAAKSGVQQSISDLQNKSAQQAPKETGDLRADCNVRPVEDNGTVVSMAVGYDLEYAIVQHEHLEFNHPVGGKAKYLEDPYNQNKSLYEAFIQQKIKAVIGGG